MPIRRLDLPADESLLRGLLAGASGPDAAYPLTEDALVDMRTRGGGFLATRAALAEGCALLRSDDGAVIVEIVTAPGAPADVVGQLLDAAVTEVGSNPLRLWALDQRVATAAGEAGLAESRSLLHLACDLPPAEPPADPPGVALDRFDPVGDMASYLAMHRTAFVGHPDNQGWGREDLERRFARTWFDPDGFFVARSGSQVIGACWTKSHDAGVGEIYLIAVLPDHQGKSLGRWLTVAGLRYLHEERGAQRGMLYTEASNVAARRLYGSLGFEVVRVKRLFERR